MVWFQCEDCGENLKKPKLVNHFHRCSAYKLSCIDCGVVFDQQSVQAHTSCVTEVEKYGPKGLNRGTNGPSKANNGKENGPDVDVSRGLSTFPPWSCSLCNVKATSSETLDLHSQGRKHRSRAKAVAAKEKNVVPGGGIHADSTKGACEDESKDVGGKETQETSAVDATRLSAERKRKKERPDQGGDGILQEFKSETLDKKLKRDKSAFVGTLSIVEEGEILPEVVKDSQEKKRKHVEDQQQSIPGEDQNGSAKKTRKKDKLVAITNVHDNIINVHDNIANGHDNDEPDAFKIVEISGGNADKSEQPKKKDKKGRHKDILGNTLGMSVSDNSKQQSSETEDIRVKRLFVHNPTSVTGFVDPVVHGKHGSGKKSKDLGGVDAIDVEPAEVPLKLLVEGSSKIVKKERSRRDEKREAVFHEVSFREWLGDEDHCGHEGTPTHTPSDLMSRGKENLQAAESVQKAREKLQKQLERTGSESTQDGIAKVVKWKKIIREVLRKLIQSVNGRLKKKDLTRAVLALAQKAVEASSINVDRKSLKAELERQVNNSPKFVVDGKHIVLSPKAK